MSLLDSSDFTYYDKGQKQQPSVPQTEGAPPPSSESLEPVVKSRIKSADLSLDSQKISSFSLRRKKDKDGDGKTHKKNRSIGGKIQPPDSPKAGRSGPSPNIKSSKKQYAHLLEGSSSSDDEEDNSGSFVLSRGHQAREKRSSFKFTGGVMDDPTSSVVNPLVPDPVAFPTGENANFPVSFTPPNVAPLGFTATATTSDLVMSLDDAFSSDPIPVLPPPPSVHAPAYQPPPVSQPLPQSQTTVTSNEDCDWSINKELYDKCTSQFKELCPSGGLLSGDNARDFFLKSNLPVPELSKIWKLSDIDSDGSLSLEEFVIAMKLVLMRRKNFEIPSSLPQQLKVPPSTAPVPMFNFPPPPPPPHANKGHAQHTRPLSNEHVLSSLPAFFNTSSRSKTEPSIAISDVQTSSIDHVTVDDKTHPLLMSGDQVEEGVVDLLTASFMSEGEVPLITSPLPTNPLPRDPSPHKEPAVSRLISLSFTGEESTGDDEDETSNLVTSGEHPIPKPRKKKHTNRTADSNAGFSELHRSQTVHGRHAPPPRPPPYKKKSVSPPPTSQLLTSPSPTPDNDLVPMIADINPPSLPPKPAEVQQKSRGEERGHGRSTSWDLTKILRDEGDMRFHDDVPSAEPPKPPPRRKQDEGGYRSDDDDGRKIKIATPIPRSASTGSLASTGIPTTLSMKSRTSSVESGALLIIDTPTNITGGGSGVHHRHDDDNNSIGLIQRSSTMSRRPAPAPPPNKPKKPMYPPSFKKVVVDTSSGSSSRERSLSAGDQLEMEESQQSNVPGLVYQKKSKSELQKTIKRLKEENIMYNNLNNELNKKLNELKQERCRLEVQLKSITAVH